MSDIAISSTARTGLSMLSKIGKQISATEERLATGKAVNSPIDNATKYFTASQMNSRAASLNSLMDTISGAQTSIKAASEGLKGIQSLIKDAQALANQALSTTDTAAKVTGTTNDLTAGSALSIADGQTITVSDGSETATFTKATGDTVQEVIDAVNDTADLDVEASLSTDGRLMLKGNGGTDITIAGTATAEEMGSIGLTAGTTEGEENATRASLARQFDAIRTEIDNIAADAGVNGTNLLQGGSISLALNEDGSSRTEINGVDVSADQLGITVSANSFQSDEDIIAALDDLMAATSSMEAHSSALSANTQVLDSRSEFNQAMADLLSNGAQDMVAADLNQEAANLVALQTRQQMAATTMSLAQSSENVALRLLL